jgi:hypothetical protein
MTTRKAAFVVGWVLLLQPCAAAEIRVSGAPEAVRIEAREASLEEVFRALVAKFELHYHAKVPLDRPVNGVFTGSLSRVMARLLEGYDYVVKRSADGTQVMILGVSAKTQTPSEQSWTRQRSL